MDDIDLTRDRSFTPNRSTGGRIRWWANTTVNPGLGRLEVSARFNSSTGLSQVWLSDPTQEALTPWSSPNGELIRNDFFGFLTRDHEPIEPTCYRCGKTLRPWDIYGTCTECEDLMRAESAESRGRALLLGNSRG